MMVSIEKIFLFIHVVCGAMGLLIGPIAMFARKTRGLHTRIGLVYHWLVFSVCISAIPLSIWHWEKSYYLLFVALFSYWFAFKGYRASLLRKAGWLKQHIGGMLGSYVAMATALLVVNASDIPGVNLLPSLVPWIVPTIVGTPLIAFVQRRYSKQAIPN